MSARRLRNAIVSCPCAGCAAFWNSCSIGARNWLAEWVGSCLGEGLRGWVDGVRGRALSGGWITYAAEPGKNDPVDVLGHTACLVRGWRWALRAGVGAPCGALSKDIVLRSLQRDWT